MKMTPIEGSSNIVSAGYDPETRTMAVEFKGNSVYHHAEVPQSVYDDLMAAKSKGSHYHTAIKGKFKHSKVDDPA